MKKEFNLGDTLRCKYTGFTGVAMGKIECINGCVQYLLTPRVDKDGKYPEEVGIDSESLVLVKRGAKRIIKKKGKPTGGPARRSLKKAIRRGRI